MVNTLWYMFGSTIVMGFFLAIFILTGTSIEILNSYEGSYVPNEVILKINEKLRELEKFEDENALYPTERRINEEPYPDDYDPYKGMDQYEKFDYDFGNEITLIS